MPVKGETILGGPFHMGPGRREANQAVAADRLGVVMVKTGKDVFGDLAEANFLKEGIRPDFVLRTKETHTGAALIIPDAEGLGLLPQCPTDLT